MPATVDTRFFLTHYLADTEELKRRTSSRMIELRREGALVPTIVVHEVYKFECENVGRDVAELRVSSILRSRFRLVDLTSEIAIMSARLRCKYKGLPTADAIVAATSIAAKSRRVMSDDTHFKEIREIKCEWL